MYIAIKNKRDMKYVKAEDIKIGELTLSELYDTVSRQQDTILSLLKKTQNDLQNQIEKHNEFISYLIDYLQRKTNNTYQDEKSIKKGLESLLVANTEPIDNVLIVDGYIKDVSKAGTLIRPIQIPDDIAKGYWKLVNGKYVIDKERLNQLWGV